MVDINRLPGYRLQQLLALVNEDWQSASGGTLGASDAANNVLSRIVVVGAGERRAFGAEVGTWFCSGTGVRSSAGLPVARFFEKGF